MMDRKVIEEIVLEVMQKLNTISSTKKPLYVVNAKKVSKKTLEQLSAYWDVKHILTFPDEHFPDIEHVLFINASQDLLVKGALGITDTFESELLAHFLLKGVAIDIVPYEPLHWLADKTKHPPKNREYVKTLFQHKETLERYGVQLVTLEKFISTHSQTKLNRNVLQKEINYDDALLTQADIEHSTHNPIVISKSTIVTPLARDRAREMGITIRVVE